MAERIFEQSRRVQSSHVRNWAVAERVERAIRHAMQDWSEPGFNVTVEDAGGSGDFGTASEAHDAFASSRYELKTITLHAFGRPSPVGDWTHRAYVALYEDHAYISARSTHDHEAIGLAEMLRAEVEAGIKDVSQRGRDHPGPNEDRTAGTTRERADVSVGSRPWWRDVGIEVAGGVLAALVIAVVAWMLAR